MKRSQVFLRAATPDDATDLALLWSDVLRRTEPEEQAADVRRIIDRVAQTDDEQIVVAAYGGVLAGAVHLRADTLSPLNLEPVVQAVSPHVLPHFRRHGVGRALMECAVAFAEERGIGHLATAAVASSRDANRFMARLALGPRAVLRVASTPVVRAKLTARSPAAHRVGGRQLPQVMAARRSMRRTGASTPLGNTQG